jgi:hypothetical protein
MTDGAPVGPWPGFGLVRTAVAFTVLAGAVAVVLPFLNALVVALTAICIAGAARPGDPNPDTAPPRRRWGWWGAGASVAFGALLFAILPAPWSLGRGLVLGASLLPLAAVVGWSPRARGAGGTRWP